jgi:PrtD family type I secretion system ABC transporter
MLRGKYLISEIRGLGRAAASLFFFSGVITALFIVPSLYMLQVHERVLYSRNVMTLYALSAIALIMMMAWTLLETAREGVLQRLANAFDHSVSGKIFIALNRQTDGMAAPMRGLVLADIATIRDFMSGNMIPAMLDLMWTPLILLVAFLMHPLLGIVLMLMMGLQVVLALLGQWLARPHVIKALAASAQAAEFGRAVMRDAESVRVMGMLPKLAARWGASRDESLCCFEAGARSTVVTSLPIRLLLHAQQPMLVFVGALLVMEAQVGPGLMLAASLIGMRALLPIISVANGWRVIWNAWMAAARLDDILRDVARQAPRVGLPRPAGPLIAARIAVTPPGAKQPVITDISFSVEPGRVVGVVGASGAGKSSLGRAIVGAWPLVRGSLTLDGHDLSHWDQDGLGVHIGYLGPDIELLPGTLAENIARFEPGGAETDAKLIRAVELANIKDIVAKLPNGLNTLMGAGGQQLSSGQRQRVAMARALYGEPALFVLDEPNANLDATGEQNLADIIKTVRARGAIVLLITHRMNMLSQCDFVLVMNQGAVHAFGERDQVINRLPSFQQPKQLTAQTGTDPVAA